MEDSTEWPNTGEMNKWYLDLYRFMAILKDITPGWTAICAGPPMPNTLNLTRLRRA